MASSDQPDLLLPLVALLLTFFLLMYEIIKYQALRYEEFVEALPAASLESISASSSAVSPVDAVKDGSSEDLHWNLEGQNCVRRRTRSFKTHNSDALEFV